MTVMFYGIVNEQRLLYKQFKMASRTLDNTIKTDNINKSNYHRQI